MDLTREITMLRALWNRLAQWWGRAAGTIDTHPALDSDRGERELEHTLMEGATRHVGSQADREPEHPSVDTP